MKHSTKIGIVKLLNVLFDSVSAEEGLPIGISRTELAAASGLSYSHTCSLVNDPEYFNIDRWGNVTPAITPEQMKDITSAKNQNSTLRTRRGNFETALIERMDSIISVLSDNNSPKVKIEDKIDPELLELISKSEIPTLTLGEVRLYYEDRFVKEWGMTHEEIGVYAGLCRLFHNPELMISAITKYNNKDKYKKEKPM